jgi:outer membrane autotransporter protein
VTGATTLDSTGQYLPLGNPNNAMAIGGPLQGHLIGVSTFTNSGIIDLQSNPVAGDVLVITGARQAGVPGTGTYISNGGTLKLDTVLNEGGAATRSDTLVVDGTLVGGGGATNMVIRNAGGGGALTVNDGILVVEVKNPARSAAGAFSLAGGFITAGAFDYFLFKGGASPGSQGNWYLRNELIAPPITPPTPTPTPEPAPGTPPLPTVVPGEAPIPLFNPEVPLKSVVPSVARSLGLVTLGTFNERQGDQLLVRGDPNTRVGAWGRVFGQGTREQFAQGARPDFDGTFAGFQAGADLLRWESSNGHSDRIGFYVAEARASGAVHGLVDAFEGAPAGHVDLNATSFGGYWTHLGPTNWYIDAVLQGTYFQTAANSIRGFANNFSGGGMAASIEGGYPIPLMSWLTFEPQIQGIWQRTSFDDSLGEGFSTITYDRSNVFTGRVGALLRGTFGGPGAVWQPYLKGNVWWGSNGFDTVTFDGVGIQTGRNGGTTLEGGGGVTGKLARNVSVYGDASYLESVSGEQRITLKGNVGVRVTW